jgi:hypothetical protein
MSCSPHSQSAQTAYPHSLLAARYSSGSNSNRLAATGGLIKTILRFGAGCSSSDDVCQLIACSSLDDAGELAANGRRIAGVRRASRLTRAPGPFILVSPACVFVCSCLFLSDVANTRARWRTTSSAYMYSFSNRISCNVADNVSPWT